MQVDTCSLCISSSNVRNTAPQHKEEVEGRYEGEKKDDYRASRTLYTTYNKQNISEELQNMLRYKISP